MILRGLGIYLPATRWTAADIALRSGVPEAIVRDKLGIHGKTVPGPDDHSNAMGIRAARAALADADIGAAQIDVLISITEEYKEYPVWTAGIHAAHALGAHRAYAYDLGQKCGTAVLALKLARDTLAANPDLNHILIAGGYRNGDLVDYRDPATRFLNNLAAGGGAAVVSRDGPGFEILGAAFHTDGSFAEDVIIPVGGTREVLRADNLARYRFHVPDPAGMKARLEQRSLDNFVHVIEQACARSGIAPHALAYVAMLHMKRSAHEAVLERIGVDAGRSIYLADYGHIGQIDPLLSLKLARDQQRLRDGDVAVLCAAGIGYVWNAICVRYRRNAPVPMA
ncbi:3-oxoacyl-[acyl-carrier-protein] synthase-3 [Fontimonas thermophila]|uniref:3-oxoacyl-[acyl-carrier-protein] synthase-3 n=1 Tax=Fontimonas thermophila TaxID=1076937 RepID=A0A1I2KB14_9GAMM|nr:3-oxoacyl-ACP synthase [Fontimonas thermophila]SFF62116.1 3-oxoacyl-[acyl-carrier-protein] synthase-3 [Fontimonas thermophila]